MSDKVIKYYCNRCFQDTRHEITRENLEDVCEDEFPYRKWKRVLVLSCLGCEEYTIVEEYWKSIQTSETEYEEQIIRVNCKPHRSWHRPPEWLGRLDIINKDLKNILDEVYSATNNEQSRLLSMGVRAVLDHMMTLILGGDNGGFEQKINDMVESKHITKAQAENIKIVVDAGSASTHRAFRPPLELTKEMVVVMENIVRGHYITGPMLQTAKKTFPPRPQRKPKTKTPEN